MFNLNEVTIYNETDEEFTYQDIIEKVVNKAFEIERLKKASCSIIIVDNSFIHKLNKEYRGIDRVTDVISFALEDDKSMVIPDDIRLLGDIYISLDKAKEQAEEYGHSFEREFAYMLVHGFYHLRGYDHMLEDEKKVMRQKEENVLGQLNITR